MERRRRQTTRSMVAVMLLVAGWGWPSALIAEDGPQGVGPQGAEELAAYRTVAHDRQLDHFLKYGEAAAGADRELALKQMVMSITLAQEAERLGLDRLPATRVELERARARLLKGAVKNALWAEVEVTDEQAEARYQEIKEGFTRPRRVRLRNLYKRFPIDADEETKSRLRRQMETLRARVVAGESFAELARQESDSQTRLQGGLLGNVKPGTLRPDVDQIAMAMEAGEVSRMIEAPDGLTLLYCEQVLPAVTRTEEELREMAKSQLESVSYRQKEFDFQTLLGQRADRALFDWSVLAQPAPADPETAFVQLPGSGSLSLAEVAALLGSTVPELKDASKDKLAAKVKEFVEIKLTIREAFARGIHESASFEDRWLWKRRQILSAKALATMVQERMAPVTDEEKRWYFEQNRQELKKAPAFRLKVLALKADGQDLREAYEQGARLRRQIELGEVAFSDAAIRHSVHSTASNGGDTGWVSRWAVPKRFGIDFLRELQTLAPGDLGKWVLSEGYLWLIRLEEVQEGRLMTFEEASRRLENRVGNIKVSILQSEVAAEWFDGLGFERLESPTPKDPTPKDPTLKDAVP